MDRFVVTYRIVAQDAADAMARAEAIAIEDTVEIPRDVVPSGYVENTILGRVDGVTALDEGVWIADGYWDEQRQRFAEMVADRERERAAMICHQCRDWEYASEDIAYRILNQR